MTITELLVLVLLSGIVFILPNIIGESMAYCDKCEKVKGTYQKKQKNQMRKM